MGAEAGTTCSFSPLLVLFIIGGLSHALPLVGVILGVLTAAPPAVCFGDVSGG